MAWDLFSYGYTSRNIFWGKMGIPLMVCILLSKMHAIYRLYTLALLLECGIIGKIYRTGTLLLSRGLYK